jgi:hypothetical protein
VNGRHVGNGVRVAAWEARWLWPPLPPPCHGNGSGGAVDGGGTRAQWRDSVADGRRDAGGSIGGQVASPHPPAPCSYLAVMEGVDGAGVRGHTGGTLEGPVASTALSSPLSSPTMVKSMSVHGALVLVKLRVGLNGRGPPSRTPCGYISQ